MIPSSGNAVVKSYRSLAVNEAMLAKIVEAIQTGEADARSTGQVRSFEVFLRGQRQNIAIGQVVVIPARVADSPEDFPTVLLHGPLVRQISPEALSELAAYKLSDGQDEYDEYRKADLSDIKDQLFKDADGKYRSIVLFIPAWSNPREYVYFKFTKDAAHLSMLVRHQVFACYFDPAMSNAFERLSNDLATQDIDVTDITPKLPYPGITNSELTQFPQLVRPELGDVKVASAAKPFVVFAKGTAMEALDDLLEPGEKAVIDQLTEDLKENVHEDVIDGDDFVKSSSAEDAKAAASDAAVLAQMHVQLGLHDFTRDGDQDIFHKNTYSICLGDTSPDGQPGGLRKVVNKAVGNGVYWALYQSGKRETQGYGVGSLDKLLSGLDDGMPDAAKAAAAGDTGLRRQPDYNEPDSHIAQANELAAKGASSKTSPKTAGPESQYEWTVAGEGARWNWSIFKPGLFHEGTVAEGTASSQGAANHAIKMQLDKMQQRTALVASKAKQAAHKAASAVRLENEKELLRMDGAILFETDGPGGPGRIFVAVAPDGFKEQVTFDGSRVVYDQPDKFPRSFRAAVEDRFKKGQKAAAKQALRQKNADVPLSYEEIMSDISEEFGPAPQVEVKEAPERKTEPTLQTETTEGKKSPAEPKAESSEGEGKYRTKLDKLKERADPERKTDWAKKDDKDQTRKSETKKDDGEKKDKTEKTAATKCALCGRELSTDGKGWSETSPGTCCHDACGSKVKEAAANSLVVIPVLARFYPEVLAKAQEESRRTAAFNMFMPGQVLQEMRPELQREVVDYPQDTYSPLIGDVGPDVASPASTSAAPAQGLGSLGQPQVVDGPSLRNDENDIRGSGFNEEFHQQYDMLQPSSLRAASAIRTHDKKAGDPIHKAQLTDFLKKVVGEVAATFIAAFKVTLRPMMDRVPGVGEVRLDTVEQAAGLAAFNVVNTGSRVRWLLSKLNDGDIKAAINGAFAQAAVWSDSEDGGFTYEVFVRPNALDTDTMVLSYEYVVGTKAL